MAKVTVTFGGEVQGEYPVAEPVAIVGRDAACQIRIDNLGISRRHCQLIKRGDGFLLQDMNSANGTFVNGNRVGEHTLIEGDEILIGKYTLKFSLEGGATPAPSPETAADNVDMDDAVHTYVMDGEKIRERLGQMRAAGGPEEEKPADGQALPQTPQTPEPPAPPAPGTSPPVPVPGSAPAAAAPRRAMDHALDFDPLKPQSPTRARPTSPTSPTHRYTRPQVAGPSNLLLYVSLATNMLLLALVAVLIFLIFKLIQQQGGLGVFSPPAQAAPAAPAPAVSDEKAPQQPGDAGKEEEGAEPTGAGKAAGADEDADPAEE